MTSTRPLWLIPLSATLVFASTVLLLRPHLISPSKIKSSTNAWPSPRTTLLPYISKDEASAMVYSPDIMPGARDVLTPHGTMRVYEWGPKSGRKILFVHGDATPSPGFAILAQNLVRKGCRVMLFDLWGRGYSDAPSNQPYTVILFAQQITYAIMSSPISWTGTESFSFIGFSLGGPIALDFAGTFPNLVKSIVLLGPAGLIRALPEVYAAIRRAPFFDSIGPSARKAIAKINELEVNDAPISHGNTDIIRSETFTIVNAETWQAKEINPAGLVQWQFDHNHAYVHAHHSTILNGPLTNQQAIWTRACDIIAGKTSKGTRLHDSKLLVLLGEQDDVIIGEELKEDVLRILEKDFVIFEYLQGDHGFVWPNSEKIADRIGEFWGL